MTHSKLTAVVVSKENKHGTGWKRIKTFKTPDRTRKLFPQFTKVARFQSKEGFLADYLYNIKTGKWSLGGN